MWPALLRLFRVKAEPKVVVEGAAALPRRTLPARGEVILEVKDVTRRFGGLVANKDMNFSMKAGEILALIGPNGAGKSTMFNQISGVDTPTSGEIVFAGQVVTGRDSREIARLGMSRSFQHVRLLPKMSVLENVAIGAHLRGSGGCFRRPGAWSARRKSACSPKPRGRSAGSGWRPTCTTRPARWPWASSASSRSPAPWPPTRRCCCSTSRPPACASRRRKPSPSCCASSRPKAWRSCWSSTTWTS
jgi:ABC-type sugar transport system ATPase subunit